MSLKAYLEAKRGNRWGWRADFENSITGELTGRTGCLVLAARYGTLLDELVDAVGGPDAALELLDARERWQRLARGPHQPED